MFCREAKIIRKGDEWFLHITVDKEFEERNPKSILALDLLRHPMDSHNSQPH
jgi:transposase